MWLLLNFREIVDFRDTLILCVTQAKHSEKIKQNILFHFSIYLPAASDLLVSLNREILIKHYDKFSAKGLRSVAED